MSSWGMTARPGALGHADALGLGRGEVEQGRRPTAGRRRRRRPGRAPRRPARSTGRDRRGRRPRGRRSRGEPRRGGVEAVPGDDRARARSARRGPRHPGARAATEGRWQHGSSPQSQCGQVVAPLISAKLTSVPRAENRTGGQPWNSSPSATARPGWTTRPARVGPPSSSGSPANAPNVGFDVKHTARKMCAECPVLEPCRDMARINRENGFWGGESEEERAGHRLRAPLDQPPGRAGRRRPGLLAPRSSSLVVGAVVEADAQRREHRQRQRHHLGGVDRRPGERRGPHEVVETRRTGTARRSSGPGSRRPR